MRFDMSESIRDGRFVELTYKVTDKKSGHILTRVDFPLGYVHGHNEILAPSIHKQLEGPRANCWAGRFTAIPARSCARP